MINVLSRVFARDNNGREVMSIAKISRLEEWQKQIISFTAEEIPEGEEVHDNPLVIKLEINPKPKEDEDDEAEDSWEINRILVDTGSSVNILFYHTYHGWKR